MEKCRLYSDRAYALILSRGKRSGRRSVPIRICPAGSLYARNWEELMMMTLCRRLRHLSIAGGCAVLSSGRLLIRGHCARAVSAVVRTAERAAISGRSLSAARRRLRRSFGTAPVLNMARGGAQKRPPCRHSGTGSARGRFLRLVAAALSAYGGIWRRSSAAAERGWCRPDWRRPTTAPPCGPQPGRLLGPNRVAMCVPG